MPASVLPEQVLHSTGVRTAPGPDGKLPAGASLFETVADYERKIIIEALEECGYSQTEAATQLRIPLSTLNQKIKRLDIPVKRKSSGS